MAKLIPNARLEVLEGTSHFALWQDPAAFNKVLVEFLVPSRHVMHLVNRGVREVFVHCLTENGAKMRLARRNGMQVVRDGAETDARLALPRATTGYHPRRMDLGPERSLRARDAPLHATRYFSHPFARNA